jgi:20S proteasome subunit alpha 3
VLYVLIIFKTKQSTFIYFSFKAAIASLKTEYKEGQMTLDEAKKLAVKILFKTLDATKLTADKGIYLNYIF